MSTENTQNSRRAVNRRTVTTGLAWSVPAVAATTAAPFAAASPLVKLPGINGWVSSRYTNDDRRCTTSMTITSNVSGRGPDGAPFGLYLYDTNEESTYENAKMTMWIRGDQTKTSPVTWSRGRGHSDCWGDPVMGAPVEKCDGHTYTPYTWTYSCRIDPARVSGDGRLYLGDFVVSAEYSRREDRRCVPFNTWAERSIDVDPDTAGPQPVERLSFERRNDRLTCDDFMNRSAAVEETAASTDATSAF
ncbi:hypothetical protein ACL90Y_11335 [Micrococcus luteus]